MVFLRTNPEFIDFSMKQAQCNSRKGQVVAGPRATVDEGLCLLQETAINVGFACSLLRTDMAQHIVTASTKEVRRPHSCLGSLCLTIFCLAQCLQYMHASSQDSILRKDGAPARHA